LKRQPPRTKRGLIDAAIALVAIVAAVAERRWFISVDTVFREYIAWLYWVKQLVYNVLPDALAGRIFGLPALLLFPLRVVVGTPSAIAPSGEAPMTVMAISGKP
jgi:hypothetical protein